MTLVGWIAMVQASIVRRQRLTVAVEHVAAIRDEGGEPFLPAGMVAEGGQIQDAERDQRDQARIDEHSEHQPLVHHGEHLPPLPDKSEPLGPWRDESGLRSVHRPGGEPLGLPACLAGSGASGSFFASST